MGTAGIASYDPFARGPDPVGVQTMQVHDPDRGLVFPCEIWYPALARPAGAGALAGAGEARDAAARPGRRLLIVYSHHSFGHRRKATFLCTHLASHGYVVAAADHSEVVAPELAGRPGETGGERAARIRAIIGSRVPDVRLLVGQLLERAPAGIELDAAQVGLAGHSLGGWTVLAVPDMEPRTGAVVALAPGGGGKPRPGILPLSVTFGWRREIPALYLAAEDDVPVPLEGMYELFGRAPAPKRMFVLRRADHQHFVDDVTGEHEALRAMTLPGEAAWLPAAMQPAADLCAAGQAHQFTRGLALAHLDAALLGSQAASRFLAGDVEAVLTARGIDAFEAPGR